MRGGHEADLPGPTGGVAYPTNVNSSGWRPVSRTRTYEHVLEQVEQQIIQGTLRAGDKLPSERTLTELLEVSRPSVREALRILEAMGVIRSTGVRGSDAGWVVNEDASPALGKLLRLQFALSRFEFEALIDTRIQLECWACQLAAESNDDLALNKAHQLLDAMDDEALSPRDFNRLDTEFHLSIADASGNPLLRDLMRALRDAVEREMVATFEKLGGSAPKVMDRLRQEHRAILDAIGAGDGDGAAEATEQHIRVFYDRHVQRPPRG